MNQPGGPGNTLPSSHHPTLQHTCGRAKSFPDSPCVMQRPPGCTCCPPPLPLAHNKLCNEMAILEHRRREAMMQAKSGKVSADEALQMKLCEKQKSDVTEKKGKVSCY